MGFHVQYCDSLRIHVTSFLPLPMMFAVNIDKADVNTGTVNSVRLTQLSGPAFTHCTENARKESHLLAGQEGTKQSADAFRVLFSVSNRGDIYSHLQSAAQCLRFL